jgi:hypothetical protein
MAEITNEYSLFPNQLLMSHNFRDVDDYIASKIEEVKALQSQGRYAEAADLVQELEDQYGNPLSDYIINAEYANAIDEETRNLEIYAMRSKQSIYYNSTEPETAIEQDVWIGSGNV